MIAAWMLYCVVIGMALTVVGVALERGLHLAGRATRWAWTIALAGSLVIPAAAWLRPEAFSTVAVPLPPVAVAEPETVVAPLPAAAALPAPSALTFSLSDLDGALRWGWGVSSAALLCVLGAAALRLSALRRRWRASVVDGREVLVSENVGPAVTGLWRPEVVVPGWALALGEPQRGLMLSHEEEHVRAADPWLLAAGTAALVLMPWNPALWWQMRRLRLAVEIDCDARVLARGGSTPEYGELLLQVGRRRSVVALGAAALSEPTSFLERRIRRMATALPRWRWVGAAVALAVAAGAVVGACEAPRPVGPDLAQQHPPRPGDPDLHALVRPAVQADTAIQALRSQAVAYVWFQATPDGDVLASGRDTSRVSLLRHAAALGKVRTQGFAPAGVLARAKVVYAWIEVPRKPYVTPTSVPPNISSRQAAALVRQHFPELLQGSDSTDRYFRPNPDHLQSLAHQYQPESFVNPRPGTAIALVFDAQDQVIGHAAGVRIAADHACSDVVNRLVPQFRYARFLSAGCADAAGAHGPVVYWGSLRRR